MDGEEAKLLQLEVARGLLSEKYELDHSGDFQRLVDAYAEGDDERLVRQVIRTHEMIQSLVSPEAWLAETRRKLAEAAESGLASELGGEMLDLVGRRLAGLRERCTAALDLMNRLGGFPDYAVQLQGLLQALMLWEKLLEEESWDVVAHEVKESVPPRLPKVPADAPNKDVAKAAIDAVLDEVKSGSWRDSLRFSAEQWRDGMRRTLPHAEMFLRVVEEFRDLYRVQKDAARQLDFSDLERFALDVLRDKRRKGIHPSPTARSYHWLFKQVLVDEYQDINELQDTILSLLSHECLAAPAEPDPEVPSIAGAADRADPLTPSPGTPGEGGGEGAFLQQEKEDPHPSPLPEYREREQGTARR
jgi:ATP-dependent helicase/nuclease subunit A